MGSVWAAGFSLRLFDNAVNGGNIPVSGEYHVILSALRADDSQFLPDKRRSLAVRIAHAIPLRHEERAVREEKRLLAQDPIGRR